MPFLRSSTLTARPLLLRTSLVPSRRTITYTPRLQLKEDRNRTPEQIEAEKQESLRKQKEGKGEWDESLGSVSEAGVKADQEAGKVKDHDKHIKELQNETAGKSGKA